MAIAVKREEPEQAVDALQEELMPPPPFGDARSREIVARGGFCNGKVTSRRSKLRDSIIAGRMATQSVVATKSSVPNMLSSSSLSWTFKPVVEI